MHISSSLIRPLKPAEMLSGSWLRLECTVWYPGGLTADRGGQHRVAFQDENEDK
jgi:hypothetical protein